MRPRKVTTADHVSEQEEIARAVQAAVQDAIGAAIAAALRKTKPIEPPEPPPASEVEQQIAKAAADPTKPPPRERHGFRGTPPPADFSLTELPDDSLLTEYEVAALARLSTNTLAAWRKRERDHPLKWTVIGGGRVRYRAGDVKHFIASGQRPRPGRPKKVAPNVSQSDAPAPRRRAARPRADDLAAPQEPSS